MLQMHLSGGHFLPTPDAPFPWRKLDYYNSGSLSLSSVNLGKTTGYVQFGSSLYSFGARPCQGWCVFSSDISCWKSSQSRSPWTALSHAQPLVSTVENCREICLILGFRKQAHLALTSTYVFLSSFISNRGDILASGFLFYLFLNLLRSRIGKKNVTYWETPQRSPQCCD